MSKPLRTIGIVVGAVALIATGVGAAAGAGLLGSAAATGGVTLGGLSMGTIAGIASMASPADSMLTRRINAPPPRRRADA